MSYEAVTSNHKHIVRDSDGVQVCLTHSRNNALLIARSLNYLPDPVATAQRLSREIEQYDRLTAERDELRAALVAVDELLEDPNVELLDYASARRFGVVEQQIKAALAKGEADAK